MITNTELFYTKAKQFQDKRIEIMEGYEKSRKTLDRFKGSQGYEEDLKKLDEKLEKDLADLRNEYRPGFNVILGSMLDAVGRRSVSAPTNEQINLLNVLKMKKKVTLEECQRTAEAVKDNPIAISVVTEIAHDHGIMNSFDHLCPEMSSQRASDVVKSMKSGIEDFLEHDTNRASRIAKKYYNEMYGKTEGGLTKRKLFGTKEEFYSDNMGLDADSFRQFSEIVDAR